MSSGAGRLGRLGAENERLERRSRQITRRETFPRKSTFFSLCDESN